MRSKHEGSMNATQASLSEFSGRDDVYTPNPESISSAHGYIDVSYVATGTLVYIGPVDRLHVDQPAQHSDMNRG